MAFLDENGLTTLVTNVKNLVATSVNNSKTRVISNLVISNNWTADPTFEGVYTAPVSLSVSITNNTKIDIQPTPEANVSLMNDGVLSLYLVNNNQLVTAYAIGNAPTNAIPVQATLTEVNIVS